MSLFSGLGDLAHLAAIFLLLQKMRKSRSCSGISLKSHLLFLLVYITRYLNLFWSFKSLYFFSMRIIFICSESYICYLILQNLRPTYDKRLDTFRSGYLLGGCAILALIYPIKYSVFGILWTFSIWLESVAILPQLFMLQRSGEAETITAHYLLAMCLYRGLYIPHWIYRLAIRQHVMLVSVFAGIIQTVLYADFAIVYRRTVLQGKKFRLPA
ncbi:HDEL receptor [Schizosaccharomyces octosporus yFS286]|uniref:ER lumen protein-retaining receptor n=1 Tax=Schizosaccharomyces octosporus (strain yFS286) TaxID=483514 RepID=S9PPG8_SCHOY|nr:HDEL receptor [Schizosaccharomyces octosporus yFS286]EPX71096.1 HDEL receptor [Schizosaccharomyces octosporus yFS286]